MRPRPSSVLTAQRRQRASKRLRHAPLYAPRSDAARRGRGAWVRTSDLASLSAPLSSSNRTTSSWPLVAAQCSGVLQYCARPHKSSAAPQRSQQAAEA
jgi:hypothetical protein